MDRIFRPNPDTHVYTSTQFEGLDLSMQVQIWKKKARSDCRLTLMTKLMGLNLGFNDLESFNETLHLQIRSETLRRRIEDGKHPEKKVVKEAMLFKLRDEKLTNMEIETEIREKRRELKLENGENSRRSRGIMKLLNGEAEKIRKEMKEIYRDKIKNLKRRHLVDEEEKISRVPRELGEVCNCRYLH